jgi:predicted ATP-grasp superfamily ATP-dependent carboligase
MACVLGDVDLVQGLALARIRCAVAVKEGNPARYSRGAARTLQWVDPAQDPETLVDTLLTFGRSQRERPVLYYDGDWDVLAISRHRDRLSEAFRFVVADVDLVEALVNKARFQELAERLELPVPRARRLSGRSGDIDVDLQFPLMVKPLTRSHDTWRDMTRAKALRVDDHAALEAAVARATASGVELLVQELITGPEASIESYHVYIDGEGAIAAEFTGRKLRTYPREYGYSTALLITRTEDVIALGRESVRKMSLRGVAKLDFKRGSDGRLYLLEVNPRFSLWHHPAAVAGINMPALVYCDLVGLPRPAVTWRPGVRWVSLAHDFQAARAERISPVGWFRWILGCEAKSGFSWNDPLPLARAAMWRTRHRSAGRASGGRRIAPRRDSASSARPTTRVG